MRWDGRRFAMSETDTIKQKIKDIEDTMRVDLKRFDRPNERMTITRLVGNIQNTIHLVQLNIWRYELDQKESSYTLLKIRFRQLEREWEEYEHQVFIGMLGR